MPWSNLNADALVGGISWTIMGLACMAWLARGFHRKLQAVGFEEP